MDESAARGRARFPSLLRLVIPLLLLAAGAWLLIKPALVRSPHAPPSIKGMWVGGFELADGWKALWAEFDETRLGWAHMDAPLAGTPPQPRSGGDLLSSVRQDGSRVRFEQIGAALVFEGQITDATILGTVQRAGERGTFQLLRIAWQEAGSNDQFLGTYQISGDRLITITRTALLGGSLRYTDLSSGRTGILFQTSASTFALGPRFLVPLPQEVQVRFVNNRTGAVGGMVVREPGRAELAAERLTFREEAVRFPSQDAYLFGTLTLPKTSGPHPGVVLVSAPGFRGAPGFGEYPHLLARRGVAALTFESRGGTSPGFGSLGDLATDTIAAVRYLSSRRDIRPKHVGLWGSYGGGPIAVAAASRSNEVGFLVLSASLAVAPTEGERDRVEHELHADAFSVSEITDALGLVDLRTAVLSGRGNPDLSAAYERFRGQQWFRYAIFDEPWEPWRRTLQYNPVPALEQVTAPLLAVFGELDQTVLAEKNRQRMQAALQRAGNADYTIVIVPRANHDFLLAETGGRKEWPRLSRIAPGYLDTIMDWILARAGTPR